MAELNCQQLTEYLKYVSSLETSVYKQKEVKKEAKKNLVFDMPKKKKIAPPPPARELKKPTPPLTPEEAREAYKRETGNWKKYLIICSIVLVVFLVVFYLISKMAENFLLLLVPVAIFIIPMLIYARLASKAHNENAHLLITKQEYSAQLNKYNQDLQEYNERMQRQKEIEKEELAYYAEQCAENEAHYQELLLNAQNGFENAKAEVAKLDASFEETQSLLNKIYSKDIIFPKYRNMVAMCAIYEYFASGRCTELGGPDGAYNLYETELRQNIVIDQLNNINNNLEQIKRNQFMLYQCLSETNRAIRDIGSDIRYMCHALDDIAESSNIAAYCSKIAAANTNAMAWMMALS